MVYLFGAISALSLALNILVYRKVTGLDIRPVVYFTGIRDSPEPNEPEEDTRQEADKPLVTIPMVQEVYQGWKNQNGIPWTQSAPPPPPIQAQKPGPLARPDGFV